MLYERYEAMANMGTIHDKVGPQLMVKRLYWAIIPFFLLAFLICPPEQWKFLSTKILGDLGDDLTFLWIFERLSGNLLAGKAILDGGMLYPSTTSLGLSELMPLGAVGYRFIFWITSNRVISFNLLFLLFYLLNYFSMYLFTRRFLSRLGATTAAAAFAFSLIRLAHYSHIHVLPQCGFPLAGLVLWRGAATWSLRTTLWLAAVVLLQFYLSVTLGIILCLSLLPVALWCGLKIRSQWRNWLKASAGFALLLAVGLSPILGIYRAASRGSDMKFEIKTAYGFSGNPKSFFVTPPGHRYGPILVDKLLGGEVSPRAEKTFFVGFAVLLLALWGGRRLKRSQSPAAAQWRPILFWSLGYFIFMAMGTNAGLYQLLFILVPPFRALRTPGRFSLAYLFILALLAGLGMDWLDRRNWPRTAKVATISILALLFFLDQKMPLPFLAPPDRLAGSTRFLKGTSDREPVLYLPFHPDDQTALYMYESLEHDHPIANGLARYYPQSYDSVKAAAVGRDWTALKHGGFKYLVIDKTQSHERLINGPAVFEDDTAAVFEL